MKNQYLIRMEELESITTPLEHELETLRQELTKANAEGLEMLQRSFEKAKQQNTEVTLDNFCMIDGLNKYMENGHKRYLENEKICHELKVKILEKDMLADELHREYVSIADDLEKKNKREIKEHNAKVNGPIPYKVLESVGVGVGAGVLIGGGLGCISIPIFGSTTALTIGAVSGAITTASAFVAAIGAEVTQRVTSWKNSQTPNLNL